MSFSSEIFSSCKTDDDILSLMKDYQYDPSVCEIGIKFLKEQINIMFVMEKTEYASNVCRIGIPMLN